MVFYKINALHVSFYFILKKITILYQLLIKSIHYLKQFFNYKENNILFHGIIL
jgi:hypothetical protein